MLAKSRQLAAVFLLTMLFDPMASYNQARLVNKDNMEPTKQTYLQRQQQEEALNVSAYADMLLKPLQNITSLRVNGSDEIHDILKVMQQFGDAHLVKKYYIGDPLDYDELLEDDEDGRIER